MEASLTLNIAKYGSMSVFCSINYSNKEWNSAAVQNIENSTRPKWDQLAIFEDLDLQKSLVVRVFHKTLLFISQEIGSCELKLEDIFNGHQNEWWILTSKRGILAGNILLIFDCFEKSWNEVEFV